ncbi:G5 domain-containing protein [Corynebacterium sp. MSK039]|uniref:G5 domain-containing protein n=1 Tax=Corynebacterium sp. MSK039 TaxID=3050193 RepID=UPI00254CAFD3|nr:G5 domain-containing protein [Corynebacterium sp. MSK039]MDK8790495.1 G5 domain-containing protein [Corynebacterium sp. MSK039]
MNSSQNRVPRRHARTGVAALSAITLALGSLSIFSHGDLTPEATAATLSGGIRDKSGAVETDAQQASDLPAGSCVVTATNKPDGSQAGFSWNTLEPSETSPDKTLWGLSVSFDNSKDRTFADWYFTNAGNLGDYLNTGEVPSMEAGQTLLDKSVTDKADESIAITGSRTQRNLNLYAEMTEEKVGQFASATADNPVRYAWQGNYKKDNPSGVLQATQGSSSEFSATVNPWPSENIECNPITVSWENREKLVIRPGEKLKVGKINVPKVQNGGTDDSLSRMVVEAYDAQGNFIGTSDTDASGGGTSSVSIDQDTGEIFYTMPEYKGTDLSDQQGMRFSVLAKPRTVDQLQAAARNNAFGGGGVFDSSNSLTRYNQANVIANHQWSFDDTQFHDPKYDPAQQAIISGVEGPNGPVITERQVIKFPQAGDKIANLVKKREDGGVEAEVKLDKQFVYSGWEAKMDPDTYEVTVTAPKNPNPGTFAQPRVIVTYSNGSRDVIPLLVVVDPNNTQVTTLVSPGTTTGIPGQGMDAQLTVDPSFEERDAVQPDSYEVVEGTVPNGWTVTVDKYGKVTATSPVDAPNFSTITPEIKAIYPDGTTDTVKTSFQVINSVKVPDYAAVSGQVGEEVSLQPVMPPVGQGGKETDEEPNRYTFEDGTTEYKAGGWTIKIDENTGVLSTTIPDNVFPGAQLTVPVKVHYATGANPQITTGTISVIGDKSGEDTAHYLPKLTKAGASVTSDFQSQLSDPKLAKFKLPDKKTWPKGWEFSIDESGTVTATPGSNIPNGESVSIPVHVTYPDGSTAEVPADFTVVGSYSRINQPTYPTVNGKIGTTVTSHVDRTHLSDASEPRFSLVTDPKDPDYIAPPRNLTWDQVKIDPETGEITTPIGKNVLPGSSADIPVRVTYKDGSKDFTIATVVAQGAQRQIYEPKYEQKTTKPGEGVASSITEDTKIPERDLATEPSKRYSVPETVDGWTVTIDEAGIVTATPPKTAKAGDGIQVPVTVTYLDGSQDTVLAPFKVRESQNDVYEPSYSVQDAAPGEEVKRNVNRNNIPDGSTFSFGMDGDKPKTEDTVDGWKYKIDPATGEVSVTPPANAKPGDRRKYHVSVTYPDGSIDEVPVGTVVKLTNKWEANPTYPEETVYPGETATLPVALDKPENVNVAKENPYKLGDVPTGWNVSIDDNGQITATAPADAKPGDQVKIPVTVTYEDGSTDTAYAVVNVVDVPTREVPFKVEYKYDATVNQGTYKVETKGVPGKEEQQKDGTWKRTEDPVNEVVVIGTKPMNEKVEWKEPIPHSTIVRENPDLAPGEVKVVQEGSDGAASYAAIFNGVNGEATVTETNARTEPKDRIVEYGPRLKDQELVTEVNRKIPFETKIVFDDSLEAGEQVVDKEGVVGEEKVTSTQKLVDGKPSGDPVVETTTVTEKQDAVIRVGTKTTGETKKTVESEVPFGVKIEFDPNLPAGTSEVVTEGKPGKKTTTVTQKVTNSQPDGEATVEEKVTEEPVDQVIKVGTKPSETSEKVEWKAQVPFEVETRPNPELKPGEIKVVQKGVPGEKTYTADFTAKGDQATVTPEEKQTKDPVNEIIEYGPAAEDTTVVTKVEKPVPFETEIVFDDTLEEGKQVVDQQGETGTEVVTSTQKIVDGKLSGDPEVNTERTKEPKKQIIRVGTKTTGKNTESIETEVPYDVKVVYDPSLKPGESKVTQEGKPGKKKVTIERDIVNSKPGDPKITEEIIEKPVEKIVTVGTKPAEANNKATWVAPLPYDTIVRVNPELKPGEMKVVQEGEYGEKEFTADFTAKDNTSTVNTTEKVTKQPVQQIIEYGPKADDSEVVTKTEKPVPFETKIVFDPNLKAGEQVVDKQGELGTEVVTSTQKIVDGKPSGEPTVTTERTKEPTNAVIRVGTKADPVSTEVKWTEKTPFETEIRVNPNLKPGETNVLEEGIPGEIEHTVTVTVDNGEVKKEESTSEISKPSPRIIEVGPAESKTELTDTHTEEIPYDTLIEYDPNLEAGKVVEDQAGKTGSKEITKTWKLENGVPVGDPEISETITQEKQDRKIRVGTKCNCETPEDPKDPENPDNPNPEDPKDPENPDNPNPQDPKDPENPDNPNPQDPKDPENPKDPKPNDPSEPGDKPGDEKPGEPSKPGDKKPGEPSKPGDEKPGEPGKPGDKKPGEPSKPGDKKPGEPNKPGDKKPGEPNKPGDKKPGEPNKPGDKKPGEPNKPGDKKPGESEKPSEQPAAPGNSGGNAGTSGSAGSSSSSTQQGSQPEQAESSSQSALARTGASIAMPAGIAALLILIGTALMTLRKRLY